MDAIEAAMLLNKNVKLWKEWHHDDNIVCWVDYDGKQHFAKTLVELDEQLKEKREEKE